MSRQMRCPRCGHEFAYDNGYYDQNIERLGAEIKEITLQLAEHNMLPWPEKKARTDWWRRAKAALAAKQKELGELKAIRKVCDQQLKAVEFQVFKDLVKERFGEEEFRKLIAEMEKETEAYRISGLMRHEYTRSNAKPGVTNINKL